MEEISTIIDLIEPKIKNEYQKYKNDIRKKGVETLNFNYNFLYIIVDGRYDKGEPL